MSNRVKTESGEGKKFCNYEFWIELICRLYVIDMKMVFLRIRIARWTIYAA